MKITLLAFAGAAARLGWRMKDLEAAPTESPRALFKRVAPDFEPGTARAAVDCAYHDWDTPIGEPVQEVAILPPVSGG